MGGRHMNEKNLNEQFVLATKKDSMHVTWLEHAWKKLGDINVKRKI